MTPHEAACAIVAEFSHDERHVVSARIPEISKIVGMAIAAERNVIAALSETQYWNLDGRAVAAAIRARGETK